MVVPSFSLVDRARSPRQTGNGIGTAGGEDLGEPQRVETDVLQAAHDQAQLPRGDGGTANADADADLQRACQTGGR